MTGSLDNAMDNLRAVANEEAQLAERPLYLSGKPDIRSREQAALRNLVGAANAYMRWSGISPADKGYDTLRLLREAVNEAEALVNGEPL